MSAINPIFKDAPRGNVLASGLLEGSLPSTVESTCGRRRLRGCWGIVGTLAILKPVDVTIVDLRIAEERKTYRAWISPNTAKRDIIGRRRGVEGRERTLLGYPHARTA